MSNISVTHSRTGSVTIALEGVTVAALSDESTIGATLKSLGVSPDKIITVQTANGTDWKVAARTYMMEDA